MAQDATQLFMSAARLFIGGTVPVSGGAVSVTAGVPSNGGTEVGFTDGPVTFRLDGVIKEIGAEQALSTVKTRKVSEVVELEFTLKEIDFARLQNYMNGSHITVNAATTPKTKTVTGGGDASVPATCVTMISAEPTPNVLSGTTQYFTIITLYSAFMADKFEVNYAKEAESMVKVIMRALAVSTRATGDQTYQIVQQYP